MRLCINFSTGAISSNRIKGGNMVGLASFFKRKETKKPKDTSNKIETMFFAVDNYNDTQLNECLNYYYNNCQVLSDSISWISNNLVGIKLTNFTELKHNWINTYLLYGNLFLLKYNDIYSIVDINSVHIDIDTKYYSINNINASLEFDNLGNGINNPFFLIHLKNLKTYNAIYGSSYALPIVNEIKILIAGNLYNANVLQNGARVDGIFSYKGTLTMDTEKAIKHTWQSFFNGHKNVGKTLFLNTHNGDVEYTPMSKSNKDMEFQALVKNCTIAIYKNFKIPLPLIETQGQTYNNYAEAQAQLYDNAIEPVITDILLQLRKILQDDSIDIDETSLPSSAKIKGYDVAKRQMEAGIFTINEVRASLDLEPLVGGDILRDNKITPIAYSGNYEDISLYDTGATNEDK